MGKPADYLDAAERAGFDRGDPRVRDWARRAVQRTTPTTPEEAVAELSALRSQREELARLDLAEVENSGSPSVSVGRLVGRFGVLRASDGG